jgi:chitinase
MTPLLEISGYSDPDPGDDHGATRWQVATDSSFIQLVLDITCNARSLNGCLMNLLSGQGTLSGDQLYFWRAKVKDARQINSIWSDWSQPYHFTTGVPAYVDGNDNGVPDDIEPEFSDIDNDGNNDNGQLLMRVFMHRNSGSITGIKAIEGVDRINYFSHVDPGDMPEFNKPDHLPYGLMNFNVQVHQVGGTARIEIILSAVVEDPVGWYKFDPVNGWYEFPVASEFGKYYLQISDGGHGDTDGVANGIIVDPIGIASTVDASANPSRDAASGSGGCFVHTSTSGRNGYHVLMAILMGVAFVCSILRKAELRTRAKITSHFKRRCILPGGVAKARRLLDIPALSRLARQAPQRLKSVN